MGSSESKATKIDYPPDNTCSYRPPTNLHFPNVFKLYLKKSWKEFAIHIGEHNAEPLYAASLPSGWYGSLFMFNGPTTDCSRLAKVKIMGNRLDSDSMITLPAIPGNEGPESIQVVMRVYGTKAGTEAHSFAIWVGKEGSKDLHPEEFEWRRAYKDEVRSLGESLRGWKLVRRGRVDPETGVLLVPEGKQVEEIVAIWAEASVSKHLSMWKAAKFQFLGSGDTGELGDVWKIVAVVTFMRLWQRCMGITSTASTTATLPAIS